jgi:hypothetical protein
MRELTKKDWYLEGVRRFGEDQGKWRFVCPSCGYVQSVEECRAAGMPEASVAFSCIGRWRADCKGEIFDKQGGPCNYAGGGLFQLNPVHVEQHTMFEFEGGPEDKRKEEPCHGKTKGRRRKAKAAHPEHPSVSAPSADRCAVQHDDAQGGAAEVDGDTTRREAPGADAGARNQLKGNGAGAGQQKITCEPVTPLPIPRALPPQFAAIMRGEEVPCLICGAPMLWRMDAKGCCKWKCGTFFACDAVCVITLGEHGQHLWKMVDDAAREGAPQEKQ